MDVTLARLFFWATVWWICSGIAEPFFLVCGVISVWLTWKIAEKMGLTEAASLFQKPVQLIYYSGWLLKEVALAATGVARIIWQVQPRITPRLFTVESKLKEDLALAVYGNSITLTPGTVCVDIAGQKIQVHSLKKAGIEDIKTGRMEKEVAKVTA